ncbi:MAG: radical SAM protein [Candidatus Nanoarchaeia archaeon]|nr:radical SAM protein [Candidatus Nanoarchaeia archaeon]MDD5358158.1 radical SAM protein [Candidatus Nanoarchaeia archaeon]MDD5589345.1 radical SAM protein [Candidatus Nanoarchaeia archaeon]
MKKKILLIEPGARHTLYPPIGLMHLAAVLRDEYEVCIKDYSGEEIIGEEVKKIIEEINPFIVGVRVLTGPPIPRAVLVSKIAKNLGKTVVWGGPHPTILPEQSLREEYIDSVVIGEGEHTFKQLLKYYEGEKIKLEGVGMKTNGKIKITPASKHNIDLDKLPMPAWDLVENVNKYFPNKEHNMLPISTTRGCAFKCGFCHNSNKNVKEYLGCYRIANPKRAIEEYKFVQNLIKNKIDILDVGEDLHLVSEDYAKRFCDEIKNSGLNLKWFTAARYQTLTKEMIDLIADSGCIRVLLGVESGSERIQMMNNKVVKLEHAKEMAKYLRKKGIFATNAYIFGHPTETEEELKQTIQFIKEIPADENLIQLYRPMPGTPYFQICVEAGRVKVPERLEDWGGFGVLGHDVNVSEVPDKILFSNFYKTNALQQSKYWINQQKFFLRNNMYEEFFRNLVKNRFTFKLKEFIESKNEKIE